jgi:hypothetical protein
MGLHANLLALITQCRFHPLAKDGKAGYEKSLVTPPS